MKAQQKCKFNAIWDQQNYELIQKIENVMHCMYEGTVAVDNIFYYFPCLCTVYSTYSKLLVLCWLDNFHQDLFYLLQNSRNAKSRLTLQPPVNERSVISFHNCCVAQNVGKSLKNRGSFPDPHPKRF